MSASTSHRQPLSDIANAHAEKKPFDLFRMPRGSRLASGSETQPRGEKVSKGNDEREHENDLDWISEEELRKSKTKRKPKKRERERVHDADVIAEKKPRRRKANGVANAALERFWQLTESNEPDQNYTIEHGSEETELSSTRESPVPPLAPVKVDVTPTESTNIAAKPIHPFFRNTEDVASTTITEDSSSDDQSKDCTSEDKSYTSSKPVHPFFLPKVEEKFAPGQKSTTNAALDAIPVESIHAESNDSSMESLKAKASIGRTVSTPHPFFAKRDQTTFSSKQCISVPRIFQPKIDAPWPRPFECQPLSNTPSVPQTSDSSFLGKRKRKHAAGHRYCDETLLSTLAERLPRNHQDIRNTPEILLTAQATIVNVANGLCTGPKHPAIFKLVESLSDSNTYLRYPFRPVDTDTWAEKYRPRCSAEVIGNQAAVSSLRSWLQEMKLPPSMRRNSDQTEPAPATGIAPLPKKQAVPKKKRKQPHDLDDFIVDDEDDDDVHGPPRLMFDDTTDDESFSPNTTPRKRRAKIINTLPSVTILVGPPGSCKTASIYACAEELGFQVFEIFGGMKRSGKDISAAVGDMTQNHLVRSNAVLPVPDHFATIETQGHETEAPVEAKQSLILLDDVDIVYEDDKNFWPAITALVEKSRRPVIMTCNDLNLVPTRDLPHSVILEFQRPSAQLSLPFLLLMALNEGHTLNAADVDSLLNEVSGDLRRAIFQLQFWCQFPKSAIEIGGAKDSCAMSLSTFSCDRLLREDAYSVNKPLDSDMRIRLGDNCKNMQLSALEGLNPWSALQALSPEEQSLETLQAASRYADTASVIDLYQAVTSAPRDRDNYVYRPSENDELGYTVIPDIEPASFEDNMAADVDWQHLNLFVLQEHISSVNVKSDSRRALEYVSTEHHTKVELSYGDFVHYGELYGRPAHLATTYGPYIRMMVAHDQEQMDNTAAFVAARGQRATRSRAYRRHINVSEDQANKILELGLCLDLDI